MVRNGFTLVELMVTLVVLGILVSIALPSFSGLIKNERLTTQANDLLSDLAFARTEAMRRGGRVTVCPSADQASCGTDWAAGRLIFADLDRDTEVTAGDEILRSRIALSGENSLVYSSALAQRIQFRGSGLPNDQLISGTTLKESFKLCDASAANLGRLITITTLGTVEISRSVSCP